MVEFYDLQSTFRHIETFLNITLNSINSIFFMSEFYGVDQLPEEVTALLNETAKESGLVTVLTRLLAAYREIGNGLREGAFSSLAVGTQNAFGDHQLDVDLKTDEGSNSFFKI